MNNLKKINDELLQASISPALVRIGDDFIRAVSDLSTPKVTEFVCGECAEWTTSEEPCCGVGPKNFCEDLGDR